MVTIRDCDGQAMRIAAIRPPATRHKDLLGALRSLHLTEHAHTPDEISDLASSAAYTAIMEKMRHTENE